MMKSILSILLVFSLSILITTPTSAQEKEMKASKELTWDGAKEAFHMVMAATFHPAEEGDLQPLKDQYMELTASAKNWNMIPVPEELKGKKLDEKVGKLYVDAKAMGKMIDKGAADEDLKKAIYALHDIFHEIVGLCDH